MLRKATSFGVVFARTDDSIVRVINPDYEKQLDVQVLSPNEYLIKLPKSMFSVSDGKDAMSLTDLHRICKILGP